MNPWTNGPGRFGRVSRALHWLMAAFMLAQAPLGLTITRMQPSLSNIWLYGLHKSLGFTLLVLVILRLIWHRITPPPKPLGDPHAWPNRLARATHRGLYALLVAAPLAGWIGASASGIDTVIFNLWTLPPIAPASEAWQKAGSLAHAWATYALLVLVALHIAGALRRAMEGDGTLARMLGASAG